MLRQGREGATGATGPDGPSTGQKGQRGETGRWKMSLLVSALALVVALGSNVAIRHEQDRQDDALRAQNRALCGLVGAAIGTSDRRADALKTADKLKALAAEIPPSVAKDAVLAVEGQFRRSGSGSKRERAAFNAQLQRLGCTFQV